MICPICENIIDKERKTKHLPLFYQCPQCSGYYHKEGPPPEYKEDYFAEEKKPSFVGNLLGKALRIFFVTRKHSIDKALGKNGGKVLDYGCGNGKLVRYLYDKKMNIEGFDPSPSAVNLAKRKGLPVSGSLFEKKYDLIMLWHSLEHTDKPLADLKLLINHLEDDGKLLIAVPNGSSLEAIIAKKRWFCYDWPFHRIHFTPKSLEKMLEISGMRIVSFDYFNPEYTVSSLVQSFLNFILPENTLYSLVANRRISVSKFKLFFFSLLSILLLIIFFPLLIIFYLIMLITKKTASFIVVAEKK